MKKEIKKISKIMFLIGVRQVWLWLCNVYQLAYEPFLTVRTLWRRKDKSQIFLLGLSLAVPVVAYAGARIVWDWYWYGGLMFALGKVGWLVAGIEVLAGGYVVYWWARVIVKNHKDLFVEKKNARLC